MIEVSGSGAIPLWLTDPDPGGLKNIWIRIRNTVEGAVEMRSGGIRNLNSDFGRENLSFYGSGIVFCCCQKSAQAEGHTANDNCIYFTWILFVYREASGGG
jgi:hypothetical protein